MAPEAAALKIQATVRGWIVKRQHNCIGLKARKAELDLVLTKAAEESTKFEPWVFDHSLEAKKVNGVPVPLIEYEEKLLRHQLKLDGMQSSGPAAGVMRHWRKKANCALQARLDLVGPHMSRGLATNESRRGGLKPRRLELSKADGHLKLPRTHTNRHK